MNKRLRVRASSVLLCLGLGAWGSTAVLWDRARSRCREESITPRAQELCAEGRMSYRSFGIIRGWKGVAAGSCGALWGNRNAGELLQYGVTDMSDTSSSAQARFMDRCISAEVRWHALEQAVRDALARAEPVTARIPRWGPTNLDNGLFWLRENVHEGFEVDFLVERHDSGGADLWLKSWGYRDPENAAESEEPGWDQVKAIPVSPPSPPDRNLEMP